MKLCLTTCRRTKTWRKKTTSPPCRCKVLLSRNQIPSPERSRLMYYVRLPLGSTCRAAPAVRPLLLHSHSQHPFMGLLSTTTRRYTSHSLPILKPSHLPAFWIFLSMSTRAGPESRWLPGTCLPPMIHYSLMDYKSLSSFLDSSIMYTPTFSCFFRSLRPSPCLLRCIEVRCKRDLVEDLVSVCLRSSRASAEEA